MGLFPETIALALAGGKVQCANLVRLDFATDAVCLWKGNGLLVTNDGESWFGTGSFGDIGHDFRDRIGHSENNCLIVHSFNHLCR